MRSVTFGKPALISQQTEIPSITTFNIAPQSLWSSVTQFPPPPVPFSRSSNLDLNNNNNYSAPVLPPTTTHTLPLLMNGSCASSPSPPMNNNNNNVLVALPVPVFLANNSKRGFVETT